MMVSYKEQVIEICWVLVKMAGSFTIGYLVGMLVVRIV